MGTNYNPKIVTDGLVLCLDAANLKSKSYNILTNPENLSGLLSLRAGASITPNDGIAPDGTQTADLITASGSGFGYYFPAWPTGNATHSYFLKPAGSSTVFTFSHVGTGMGGSFNFSTKTFTSMNTYTGSYEELPNGWFLVNFHTTSETNNYYVEVSFNNNNGGYIWGAQLTPFNTYKPYVPQSSRLASIADNTKFVDLSGFGNTGTLINGPSFSGDNGGSIVFDGTNDFVEINDANSLDIAGNNITLEIVYKINVLASAIHGAGLICKGSGGNDGAYEIVLVPQGSFNYLYFRCISLGFYWPQITPMSTNTIYIVHAVMRQGLMLNYINGKAEGTGLQTTGNIFASTQSLTIGTRQLQAGSSSSSLNGNIYSAKIYNRALTAQEIQQNFNALRGRYGV